MKKCILLFCVCFFIHGCASQSGNMARGTESYGFGLSDQREALRTVSISNELPEGATVIGSVDASRCHRNTLEAKPTEEMIRNDLRIFAYAKGADGIYGVTVRKESGLLKNCWHILTGKATMYRLGK